MTWKLRRVRQCEKCPWKVSTDPYEIPGGYDLEKHRALVRTMAVPGKLIRTGTAMACHESPVGEETHCVGWLVHQLGRGNNLPLRIAMLSCENVGAIRVDGPQHQRFEDTLPEERPRISGMKASFVIIDELEHWPCVSDHKDEGEQR